MLGVQALEQEELTCEKPLDAYIISGAHYQTLYALYYQTGSQGSFYQEKRRRHETI